MRDPKLLNRGECKKQICNSSAHQSALDNPIFIMFSSHCYTFNLVSQE